MAVDFNLTNFNTSITDGVTNSGVATEDELNVGIRFNSQSNSQLVNKLLYNISSTIEYIQNSSGVLWQKDKQYKLGSIVNIIEDDNDYKTLRKFRCIKVDDDTGYTTSTPVLGSVNYNMENLTIYFSNVSEVNNTYWKEIFDKDSYSSTITLNEKSPGLYIFEIPNEGVYKNNFDVLIKRFNTNTQSNDVLSFSVNFEVYNYNGEVENTLLSIYNVNCSNYNRSSFVPKENDRGFISSEDQHYIFGKNRFALLGVTMSVKNNRLNLDIYSDEFAYIDDNSIIEITITNNGSDLSMFNTELTEYNGYTGKEVVVIRSGYDNSGSDCGYIVETTTRLTTEEMFKSSLLLITDSNCINQNSERPGYSKNFTYSFNPDNMINVVSDATDRDYSNHVLPHLKGESRSSTDSTFNMKLQERSSTLLSGSRLIPWSGTRVASSIQNMSDPIYKCKAFTTVTSNDKTKNIFDSKNAELNIYNTKPALYPKSKKVYRYFKY